MARLIAMYKYYCGCIIILFLSIVPAQAQAGVDRIPVHSRDTLSLPEQLICGPVITLASVDCHHWENYLACKFGVDPGSGDLSCRSVQVTVYFLVDRSGDITDVRVKGPLLPAAEQYISSALKQYPGKWKPATQNGRVVKSFQQMVLRIPENSRMSDTIL